PLPAFPTTDSRPVPAGLRCAAETDGAPRPGIASIYPAAPGLCDTILCLARPGEPELMRNTIYVAGTCDTKGRELAYVRQLIAAEGLPVLLADLSTGAREAGGDIDPAAVAAHHPEGREAVFTGDRGRSVAAMAVAFERFMASRRDVAG